MERRELENRQRKHCWVAAVAVLLLMGCRSEQADEEVGADATAKVDSASPVRPAASSDSLLPGFDPGALVVGHTLQWLRVAAMDVNKAFEDSVWVGSVKFSGELEVRGVYQEHFDYPEVSAACFQVTESASVRRVPRFAPDAHSTRMKTWFCFTNAEQAVAQLGPPEQPREATIVIDDYTAIRYFSDAWATGRLVRVIDLGAPSRRTLREPF